MTTSTWERLQETAARVASRTASRPRIGIVLGSGLGGYAARLEPRTVISYEDLPHFPRSTVPGHSGDLVLGRADTVDVAVLNGRVHLYEGYAPAEVVYPIRLLGCLGVERLVVTSAAGGIDPEFRPGDLMLITDHLNLTGSNPLTGPNTSELGTRFPDMSDAYALRLREMAIEVAGLRGIELRQGIYAGLAGPSYETPAEIRMLGGLGAHAVGMSTVAEVIAARHMGIEVLGISCITNLAAGMLDGKLTHQEVIQTAERAQDRMVALLEGLVPRLASSVGTRP